MLTPKDFGLPFSKFRPYQLETALKIKAAFERGVKLVLLQAPTGIGKTLIAVLVAIMLELDMLYTSHTKALQAQFMKDFKELGAEELTGRRNYLCLKNPALFPRLTAELCTWKTPNCKSCELAKQGCEPNNDSHCPCKSDCPYEIQKRRTQRAPIGVLNTSYHLLETNFAGGFDDGEFTVLDEVCPDCGRVVTKEEQRKQKIEKAERILKEMFDPVDITHEVTMPLVKDWLESIECYMVEQGYRLPKWERPKWLRWKENAD